MSPDEFRAALEDASRSASDGSAALARLAAALAIHCSECAVAWNDPGERWVGSTPTMSHLRSSCSAQTALSSSSATSPRPLRLRSATACETSATRKRRDELSLEQPRHVAATFEHRGVKVEVRARCRPMRSVGLDPRDMELPQPLVKGVEELIRKAE